MLNVDVEEYIQKRLQAGDSPSVIANTIHGWGWRTDTLTTARIATPRAHSSVLHIVVAVITASLLSLGGVLAYGSSNSKTHSVANEFVKPETVPQPPAIKNIAQTESDTAVLGASTKSAEITPEQDKIASISADLNATGSAKTTTSKLTIRKSEYTIALIGDSMIDTLDSHLPMLSEKLEAKYTSKFNIYNYGIGAQNVEMGLARFHQEFNYKGREYPPLSELKPDILIIGSFAYNPFSEPDTNKYWLTMAKLAENAKATGADVYFLADIAPLKETFGVGSLEWSTDTRVSHSQKIVDQLNSFVGLSKSLNIPLIDVYSISQARGQFGSGSYIDTHDGIHANSAGRQLVIEQIVKELVVN